MAVQQPTKPFLIAHGVRQGVLHVIDTRISYHGIERCHPRKEGAANRLLKALEALQVGVVLGRCRLVRGRFSPKQLNERPRRDRASLNLRPLNAPEPFTPRRPPALPGCRRGAHQPLRCPLPPLRGHPPFRFSLAQASPKTWAATLPLKVARPPWRRRKIDDRRPWRRKSILLLLVDRTLRFSRAQALPCGRRPSRRPSNPLTTSLSGSPTIRSGGH